jgi:hypothetical protein
MNVSKNFIVQEFVSPKMYKDRGNQAIRLINKNVVEVVQWIRDRTGKEITINNWNVGGQYSESGVRDYDTSFGAIYSDHKFGNAADIKVEGMTPDEVRQLIRQNWFVLKEIGLTIIEKDTPSWTHVSCAWTGLNYLLEVPYK